MKRALLGILASFSLGWLVMGATCTIPNPPGKATPTATAPPASSATATAPATSTTPPVPTLAPTAPPVGFHPPTVDFVNGGNCAGGVPGDCEFNTWMKISIPDPANFTPPCTPNECPFFWNPQGMAKACDHMFTDPGASGGVIDPKTQQWVSIMYYVCSARIWDYPGNIQVEAALGSRMCGAQEPSVNCVKYTPRTVRTDDGYNGSIAGNGSYYVRMPWGAYTCKDPKDLAKLPDGSTSPVYTSGICPSGNVTLPGAGAVNGPFTVHQ